VVPSARRVTQLPPLIWEDASILLTGGTGSFGRRFLAQILERRPKAVRIFSRDELKQSELRAQYARRDDIRFFIGDIRDSSRLSRAADGCDLIVHAAAMKQVETCEYNPFEAIQTNVHGAENIVNVALDVGVPRTIALSTDKAVNPINLYGATKLCAEKIFVQGNTYAASHAVRFSCVRYGNVVGSRGSVIPLFQRQRESGVLTITDERMTRFFITLGDAVEFVISSAERMIGGEIFLPKIPSVHITDLAQAIAPEARREIIGIRPGEKLHEQLLMTDEARHTVDQDDRYVVLPEFHAWTKDALPIGKPLPEGFTYGSNENDHWLGPEDVTAFFDLPEVMIAS
jgi:UDP-N-acetylglucosamine 4,6-dehydratase/5-epimerase